MLIILREPASCRKYNIRRSTKGKRMIEGSFLSTAELPEYLISRIAICVVSWLSIVDPIESNQSFLELRMIHCASLRVTFRQASAITRFSFWPRHG